MLKKRDLAEEFGLVVQQEIKNHNNAISASNLAVNNLNIKLDSEHKLINSRLLKMQNRIDCLQREVDVCHSSFSSIYDEFKKLKSDQSNLNTRNHNEIETIDQSVETVYRNQQKSDKRIDSLEEDITLNNKAINVLAKVCDSQDQRLTNRIIKSVKIMKEEILSLPSEALKVKKDLEEQISMHKIDNEGLLREIKVLKKTVFINEKKIENLYTLIDRIYTKL